MFKPCAHFKQCLPNMGKNIPARLIEVKLPSQTEKQTHGYLSVKPGHNCYARLLLLLLLFVSGDLRSYINTLIEILVIIIMY